MADAVETMRERQWALKLLKHLYHEVYLDAFEDGAVVIECKTCDKTLLALRASQKLVNRYAHRSGGGRGRLFKDAIQAVAGLDVPDEEVERRSLKEITKNIFD